VKRAGLGVVTAVLGLAVGVLNAMQLSDRIRLVDIIGLYAAGMAAGAGLVKAMVDLRAARRG
jgi:hypothetical protein